METGKIAKVIPLTQAEAPRLSEFYVHAVLQAARASYLGLSLDSAKSWGLNRAIFYEAAKNGYIGNFRRSGGNKSRGTGGGGFPRGKGKGAFGVLYAVGGERAYAVNGREGVRFVIGGKEQTPQMFDRQVKRRFPNWSLVWEDALTFMREAPESTVRSASRFHKDIYKRLRGDLAILWPRGQSALQSRVSRQGASA